MERTIRLFFIIIFTIIKINGIAFGAETHFDKICGKQLGIKDYKKIFNFRQCLKSTSSQSPKEELALIHTLMEKWESAYWENDKTHNYTYDDMGNLEIFEIQIWNSDDEDWNNWYKETYISNDEGNRIEMLTEIWDEESNEWVPDIKEAYTYEDENLSLTLVYSWTGVSFELWFRHIFSYDDNENLIETLTEDYMSNDQWEFLAKALYTYDEFDRLIQGLYQEWDADQWQWVDILRGLGTYENDENSSPIEWLTQINFYGWINLELETFTYDEDDRLIELLEQIWEDEDWLNQNNIFYGYDENENLMEELHKIWTENEIWEDDLRYSHSYEEITNIEEKDVINSAPKFYLAANYPNPFNPETTISFAIPVDTQHALSLRIYDISGKLIKTLINGEKEPGYHSVIWDGRDEKGKEVSSGAYFYRIESENFSQTKQCLLLK
jgi:hypothetical protein